MDIIWFCHFLLLLNFTTWYTPFWTSNSCFWYFQSISPMEYLYLLLLILEEQNQKKSYPQNQVTSLTNIWLYLTFMAFKLKSMAFPFKLTPNDPNQGIFFFNFGVWTLRLAFKNIFDLFLFFWGLWCLRSPVVYKNHIYMWIVLHPTKYQIKIPILIDCVMHQFKRYCPLRDTS